MKQRLSVYLCVLGCLVVAGCGVKQVKVHGKLTYGSATLKGKDHEPIEVVFCPYNGEGKEDGQPYTAEVDQDNGTYEVVVPAGRHRVCVARYQEDLRDQFQGAFAPGQSPILRDVQGGTEINLDLQQLRREADPATVSGAESTAMPP